MSSDSTTYVLDTNIFIGYVRDTSYSRHIDQLTYLLFLKMDQERRARSMQVIRRIRNRCGFVLDVDRGDISSYTTNISG